MTDYNIPSYKISVSELARFWQRGDINIRFTGRSTAIGGTRGHQTIQKKRGDDYVSEKSVSIDLQRGNFSIRVQGRVDGFIPASSPPLVEEIKTLRVAIEELPASIKEVHLAQLKLYAYIIGVNEEIPHLGTRLCYLNLNDGSESWIAEEYSKAALAAFFELTLVRYTDWLVRDKAWRATRDKSISASAFPYDEYRQGQRDMAVAAYRSLVQSQQLVMQAPTGIGKTMATIFPAVKALTASNFDKVFYLSAKTSGKKVAENTIDELSRAGYRLRSVTITAKDKICFNPAVSCDPEYCEFARGYYDRLGERMKAVLEVHSLFTRGLIEQIAREYVLCPFELSLDISPAADLVICDYNYVFDPAVYLRRFFEDSTGKYALLLDEAHNLVDRGRDMFSAELLKSSFLALRRALKDSYPLVAKKLVKINREILALRSTSKGDLTDQEWAVIAEVPSTFLRATKDFCDSAEDLLRDDGRVNDDLMSLYFDCLRFLRTNEQADDNYIFFLLGSGKDVRLKLFCVNPASRLAMGFKKMESSICFSGTMKPQEYFCRLLGLDADARWYQLPSPFDADNLGVFVASYVGASYRERPSSLDDMVELIYRVVSANPGNYLVFFPSYAYLQAVYDLFSATWPVHSLIMQERSMSEESRQEFLEEFQPDSCVTAFAVMGGIFGEGIDLKGKRLIGVVVASVGLPQLSVERELIRQYFGAEELGFEFAYQYPGMSRVLQTAGRVIRDAGDKGIICLVDRRFGEQRYTRLFPGEWKVQQAPSIGVLSSSVDGFWRSHYSDEADTK